MLGGRDQASIVVLVDQRGRIKHNLDVLDGEGRIEVGKLV
jgi:hypothetical protein